MKKVNQQSIESLAIEELYIQFRALMKVLEEKGILSDDDFRVAYAREVIVSPGEKSGTKINDYLAKHRKKFLS